MFCSSERERYTAMKSIGNRYYTRTISSICCCTEQFPWFPAFRQMGCIFMWMAMQMTEVANSKKEIDEYNQVPADSILESI